jgi:uncharacterized membrane protein
MDKSLQNPPDNPSVPEDASFIQSFEKEEVYSGPVPSPEYLQAFGLVDPSFPERIMKMTEENNRAEVTMKNRFSLVNMIVPIIGQAASFLISCIGFGTAIFLAMRGIEGPAIAATIGGIAPIVIAALANLKAKS